MLNLHVSRLRTISSVSSEIIKLSYLVDYNDVTLIRASFCSIMNAHFK